MEHVTDFGLDGLFVVTDLTPPAAAPTFTPIQQEQGTISLRWTGAGRVFQVNKASDVAGPYLPYSPLVPDLMFEDVGAAANPGQSFYRLRQW